MSLSKETPFGCNRYTILPSVKTIYVYNLERIRGKSVVLNFAFDSIEYSCLNHGLNEFHLCNEHLTKEFQREGQHFKEKFLQIFVCPDIGFERVFYERNLKLISLNTENAEPEIAYFLVFNAQNNGFPKLFDLAKATITKRISFLPFINFTDCTTHTVFITICHAEKEYETMLKSCICRKTSDFRY